MICFKIQIAFLIKMKSTYKKITTILHNNSNIIMRTLICLMISIKKKNTEILNMIKINTLILMRTVKMRKKNRTIRSKNIHRHHLTSLILSNQLLMIQHLINTSQATQTNSFRKWMIQILMLHRIKTKIMVRLKKKQISNLIRLKLLKSPELVE